MITTTKSHLEAARKWIDHMLANLYEDKIEPNLDVTTLKKKSFPWCLDIPLQMAASLAYTKTYATAPPTLRSPPPLRRK